MSKYLTDSQMTVALNILGAVETGGQIYGNRRYDDFTNPYANSPSEYSCTAGAYQEYGENLRQLLIRIKQEHPVTFARYDEVDIATDIRRSWSDVTPYKVYAGTVKAKAIVSIISSEDGKKVQDARAADLIDGYLAHIMGLGVTNVRAALFCAECEHLGGAKPIERIIKRATDKNSITALYKSLMLDQNDTSNSYQIGDKIYQTRHNKCKEWLELYIGANEIIGKSEGAKAGHGQAAVDLAMSRLKKNQYTQSSLRTQVFSGYSDCSSLVWKCFERAYGIYVGSWTGEQVDKGRRVLLCQNRYAYGKLTQSEIDRMQPGDCIYYGSGSATHVEMYIGNGQQIGHGSGTGPTIKNCLQYGHSSGVYQIRRFVADDTSSGNTVPVIWKATGTATCTGDDVNVRLSPAGSILRTVNKGNRFEVDGNVVNGWAHVKVVDTIGYIYNDYVKADKISDNAADYTLFKGRVTASELNVRNWYGLDANGDYYPNIRSYPVLECGEIVDVLVAYKYAGDTWYKVKINNTFIGFVHGNWIQKV